MTLAAFRESLSFVPFDWTTISDDPISPKVRSALLAHLRTLDRGKHESREALIEGFVKGRTVLDVGVAEHALVHTEQDRWLHGKIARWAKSAIGVDMQAALVEILNGRGYDVRCVDATSDVDLGVRVERVVLGEIIEHVNDPVRLLQFAKRHLAPGGRILATTPNPFYIAWIYEALRANLFVPNAEHVRWVSPAMALEIGRRAKTPLVAFYRLVPPMHTQQPKLRALLAFAKATGKLDELVASHYAFELDS